MAISTIGTNGLTTPLPASNLGTPSAINLSNATALPKSAMPSGSVLQVQQGSQILRVGTSGGDIKLQETSITTTVANSKILVFVYNGVGGVGAYTDTDLALAIGFKVGTTSTSPSDYTPINGNPFGRQAVTNLGAYFAADTCNVGGAGGIYWTSPMPYMKLTTPNQATGSLIYFALWASTDGTYYFGGTSGSTISDAGMETTITLMEIAP
jgi:hypothetical protein